MRILFILLMLTICINLFAQSVKVTEERFFYGSDIDKDLDVVMPGNSFFDRAIMYGAILSPVFIFEDNSAGRLGAYILNAKVWGKVYLWNNSFLYISGKNSYLGITQRQGTYDNYKSDNVLDLDQAFLSASYLNNSISFSLGRKYYTMGTGLVLNGRGDGAEAVFHLSVFSIDLLGLYTGFLLKDNNPYNLNDKDITDGAKRMFGGGTVSVFFYNQKVYLLGLVQMDFSKQTKSFETKYNSEYYGIGLEGVLFSHMSYYGEFVYERGTSYINSVDAGSPNPLIPFEKSNISAFAINSGIYYYMRVALNPMLIVQYSFGSGDEHRTNYTSSNRPKEAKGDDRGFIAFGTFAGGYALKPNLGNIHIIRGGFSFAPFGNVSLGAKYLYYLKDKKEAPINANEAPLPEAFIGQGVDVSFRWQICYDLSMYVNYGLFLPGDAYDKSTLKCNFVMAGINLSI
ncbi:MAG: alginate export family protein [Spirochaetes bacterium]|nr:alginate export family protein [Spirochaetota bacterium]